MVARHPLIRRSSAWLLGLTTLLWISHLIGFTSDLCVLRPTCVCHFARVHACTCVWAGHGVSRCILLNGRFRPVEWRSFVSTVGVNKNGLLKWRHFIDWFILVIIETTLTTSSECSIQSSLTCGTTGNVNGTYCTFSTNYNYPMWRTGKSRFG